MAGKHTLILMTQPLGIPIVYHVMPYVTPFCYESLIKRIFKFSTHYEFSSLSCDSLCDAFCSDNSLLYISFSFLIVYINFSLRKKKKNIFSIFVMHHFLKAQYFYRYNYILINFQQINKSTHTKKANPRAH